MLFSDKTTVNKPTCRSSSFCHFLKENDTLLCMNNKNSNNNTLKKKKNCSSSRYSFKKGLANYLFCTEHSGQF